MKLTLDTLKLQIKRKKNVLGVFNGSLETYARYSRVADKEQKKGLSVFKEEGHDFLIFSKGSFSKKV